MLSSNVVHTNSSPQAPAFPLLELDELLLEELLELVELLELEELLLDEFEELLELDELLLEELDELPPEELLPPHATKLAVIRDSVSDFFQLKWGLYVIMFFPSLSIFSVTEPATFFIFFIDEPTSNGMQERSP